MSDHRTPAGPTDVDDVERLLGAYALDALDDDERAAVEVHLEGCAACRDELAGFVETTAALADAAATAPPAELRASVLAAAAATRQDPPSLAARRAARRRQVPARAVVVGVAAAVLVVAALAAVVLRLQGEVDQLGRVEEVATAPDAETVTLAGDVPGTVRVTWSEEQAGVLLVADGLPAVPEGRAYQLWLIGEDGPTPSVTFAPGDDGRVEVVADGGVGDAQVVGITEEPATGSPAPTGDVLAAAELPS